MKPHTTIKNMLVHPKDKRELEDKSGVIYKIPCASCEQTYIGETGRNFGYRFKEHKKAVEFVTAKKVFTRSQRKTSQSEINKSAITDHAVINNHIIDWKNTTIIDNEENYMKRKIKEAIHIKQTTRCLNRDDGYILSGIYAPVWSKATPGGSGRHH